MEAIWPHDSNESDCFTEIQILFSFFITTSHFNAALGFYRKVMTKAASEVFLCILLTAVTNNYTSSLYLLTHLVVHFKGNGNNFQCVFLPLSKSTMTKTVEYAKLWIWKDVLYYIQQVKDIQITMFPNSFFLCVLQCPSLSVFPLLAKQSEKHPHLSWISRILQLLYTFIFFWPFTILEAISCGEFSPQKEKRKCFKLLPYEVNCDSLLVFSVTHVTPVSISCVRRSLCWSRAASNAYKRRCQSMTHLAAC